MIPSQIEAVEYAEARIHEIDLSRLKDAGLYLNAIEYYLTGTYPPLKAMYRITDADIYKAPVHAIDAYVHIPFCSQYCTFCHFAKEIRPTGTRVNEYLGVLQKNIEATTSRLGRPHTKSVFFGGGTPSFLSAAQISPLLHQVADNLRLEPDCEITFELHPRIVREPGFGDKLQTLMTGGVNRWVFGVQSMNNHVLEKLNRGHSADDVLRLWELLCDQGIRSVSLDLMYGLPYQTIDTWYRTICELVSIGVRRFNVFPLMLKPTDPIARLFARKPEIFANDFERLKMHFVAEYVLYQSQFRRGPVLYYSQDPVHSHQQENKYDDGERVALVPFGASGFGYVNGCQFYNRCDIDDYIRYGACAKYAWRGYQLSITERMRRTIMFGIRSRGISRHSFAKEYGIDPMSAFPEEFELLQKHGLLKIDTERISLRDLMSTFASSFSRVFASCEVKRRVAAVNTSIDRRHSLLEKHDYSPIGRLKADEIGTEFGV